MNNNLFEIKIVLLDAEEKQVDDHQVKVWLERLKVAVYEADDLFDEFEIEAQIREAKSRNKLVKQESIFFLKLKLTCFSIQDES